MLPFLALALALQIASASEFGIKLSDRLSRGVEGSLYIVDSRTIQLVEFKVREPTSVVALYRGRRMSYQKLYLRTKIRRNGEEYLRPISIRSKEIPPRRAKHTYVLRYRIPRGGQMEAIQLIGKNLAPYSTISVGGRRVPPYGRVSVARGFVASPKATAYGARANDVSIVDHRTFELKNFFFDGTLPPDGWIYSGEGEKPPPLGRQSEGTRLAIQGRDADAKADQRIMHCAMKEKVGASRLRAELPEGKSVCDLRYIGVYCYKFGEDFGHTKLQLPSDWERSRERCLEEVPAYLPPVRSKPLRASKNCQLSSRG